MARRKKTDIETVPLFEESDDSPETEEVSEEQMVVPEEKTVPEVKLESNPDPPISESAPPMEISQALISIFSNRVRTTVPTLISYKPIGSTLVKHVIVDLDAEAITLGWLKYKELSPKGSAEDYLLRVYGITHTEIPRMYRAVATVSLL